MKLPAIFAFVSMSFLSLLLVMLVGMGKMLVGSSEHHYAGAPAKGLENAVTEALRYPGVKLEVRDEAGGVDMQWKAETPAARSVVGELGRYFIRLKTLFEGSKEPST